MTNNARLFVLCQDRAGSPRMYRFRPAPGDVQLRSIGEQRRARRLAPALLGSNARPECHLVTPRATAVMFAQILDLPAQGRGVQIFPKEVELSTQQAAAVLNVSRPYLIGLLEAGKTPSVRSEGTEGSGSKT